VDASPAPGGAHAKAHGAFYTAAAVAEFLVGWALRSPENRVMDPSFGGGVFLEAAAERLAVLGGAPSQVFGVEFDPEVHGRVSVELGDRVTSAHLIRADFFDVDPARLPPLAAVVGNPPFIRYQSFHGQAREKALQRAAEKGVTLNQLAGSWAAFLVHASAFLERSGCLAMVAPVELGHAAYARPVLEFFTKTYRRTTLLTFKERLFPDLSQDTLLVLAEGKGGPFEGLFWKDIAAISELSDLHAGALEPAERLDEANLIAGEDRLVAHFISEEACELYRRLARHPRVTSLGEAAEVGIGYVSGANSFFHLSLEDAATWNIPESCRKRAVFRSRAFSGLSFDLADWQRASKRGDAGYLFALEGGDEVPESVRRYLEHGQAQGIPRAYKCRVRSPWYAVPHVHQPDAFLTYMSGLRPQLVANEAGAVAPNTLHLVRFKEDKISPRALAASWQTSLTSLSVELEGHALGGGMLKLEPSEAKRVLLAAPKTDLAVGRFSDTLDGLARQGEIEAVRQKADKIILQDMLGLTEGEVATLYEAARTLQHRRYYKGKRS
jgi:adenine-specific DNA methylase